MSIVFQLHGRSLGAHIVGDKVLALLFQINKEGFMLGTQLISHTESLTNLAKKSSIDSSDIKDLLLRYYVSRGQHTAELSIKKQDVRADNNHTLSSFSQGIFCEDKDKWRPKIFLSREVLGIRLY